MDKEDFLVIGAGPCGLSMARALKQFAIEYDHVEADDDVGGNWYHGAYPTANILSSKDVTEYPEFHMPADYPDFPSQLQMHQYYRAYTEHYGLREKIRFQTKVIFVKPVNENLWEVTFANGEARTYRGVLVCNGHHWSKRFPSFEGEFTGESFHSKDYKSPEQLRNKRVLVVGAGNSAFDIASEAARVGTKCYISVRRGIWIFPKIFMGKPLSHFRLGLPRFMMKRTAKFMLKLAIGNPENYGFPKPTIDIFERHPTINTDTLINIKNGRIKVKTAVRGFSGRSVEFEDGSKEEIDTVVYATGFNVDFPFFPKELKRVEGSVVKVYGNISFEDYKGLYIVGWFQPRGGIGSLVSPTTNFICECIRVEEKTGIPIGKVFKEIGEPMATSHLIGGIDLLKWLKKKEKQLPKLMKIASRLAKGENTHINKVIPIMEEEIHQDITVF